QDILNLAGYIVASGNTMMHFERWATKIGLGKKEAISSQRISELFARIDINSINDFLTRWWQIHSQDQSFLIYDVTSMSTDAKNITKALKGYNRDKEMKSQINLGLIIGEQNELPLGYVTYAGSINDKTYFPFVNDIVEDISSSQVTWVFDQGFQDNSYFKELDKKGIKFLTTMPRNLKLYGELVEEALQKGMTPHYFIDMKESGARGYTRESNLYGLKLQTHIIFDPEKKAVQDESQRRLAISNDKNLSDLKKNKGKITPSNRRYYTVEMYSETDFSYSFNVEEYASDERKNGFFIYMTNYQYMDLKKTNVIYRRKDLVEQSFDCYKNDLGFRRLKTHNDETTRGKTFVGFIALILRLLMTKTLKTKERTKYLTVAQCINYLIDINVYQGNKKSSIEPLSSLQKDIYSSANIEIK
ncbi:hypothetical protein CKF54_07490, partial [Psittacicella hinzii]